MQKAQIRVEKNMTLISPFQRVHRTEVLAGPSAPLQALCRMVKNGELSTLLTQSCREEKSSFPAQKRLSADQIEQLVQDYKNGEGSIYRLAETYGIHHQTIALHLKACGLALGRTSLNQDELARVHKLHQAGFSANRIGLQIGRDPKTVRASLQE